MPERSSNPMSSRIPFPASTPEVSYGFPSPHSPSRIARRLQYKIKSRGGRHVVPLTLIGLLVICLIFFSGSSSSHGGSSSLESHGRHGSRSQRLGRGLSSFLGSRSRPAAPPKKQGRPGKDRDNGLSLLVQEEEELIAEDDLFWDKYEEELPRTEAQRAADADILAHKEDVAEQNRRGSLRALVWWLAEGGVIPDDWEVPSASYIRKIGARGMERLLEDIEPGYPDEPIFEDGWADYAKKRYRVVVFSKSYCPYSARAKGIIHQYHLSPAPFIIELDHRTDTSSIQSILEHLTGRRTVPNILMDFVSVGGSDDLTLMQSEGSLKRKFAEMELLPGSKRRPLLTGYDRVDGVAPAFIDPLAGGAPGQLPNPVADRAVFKPDEGSGAGIAPDGLPAGKMRLPPADVDEDDDEEDDEASWDAWERAPTTPDDLPTRTDQDDTPLLQRNLENAPAPPIMGGLLGDQPVTPASRDNDDVEDDDEDEDEELAVPPHAAGIQQPLVAPDTAMAHDDSASPLIGADAIQQPPMGNVAAAKAKVAAEAAARLASSDEDAVVPLKQSRLEKLRDRARAAAAEKRKQELARLKKLSEQPAAPRKVAAAGAAAAAGADVPVAKKARKVVQDKAGVTNPKAKKAKVAAAAVPKRGAVLGAGAEVIHHKGRANEGKKAVAEKKKARVLA